MKILVATDGSRYSKMAVEECGRIFASKPGVELKIVSVFQNIFPIGGEPFAMSADYYRQFENEAKAEAEGFVAEAAEQARQKFSDAAVTTDVRPGTPGRELVEAAEEWGADLVVVGSHGRGFWGRMLIGSTSDAVMHHADCSVLIVRSREEQDSEGD